VAAGDRQLSLDAARAAIAASLHPITETETVPLLQALGRVLAGPVRSPIDVPAHDNSAMDGYAFDGAELRPDAPLQLRAVGTLLAGALPTAAVGAGDCLRIMTGAVMPPGLDTVVPLELCRVEGDTVMVATGTLQRGENRRLRGEDLACDGIALPAGRRLRPADLGLLASLGFTEVAVFRRLRVALFSTGDELRAPGQPLDAGAIYDSNRTSLHAALLRLDVEVLDLGLVRDDPAALQATLAQALAGADVVLTSGGVSAGDADHTRMLLAQLGEVGFWKVAMRPGRPFAFGALRAPGGRRSWLFGLPGNPVAALVTFYALARDALLQLAGAAPEPLVTLRARCAHDIRKRPGRTELQRARVERSGDGQWAVRVTGSQGAGVLSSMSQANALIVLPHDSGSVTAGEPVEVWLFDALV
jgi:molybdopterin molybdotransferase